MDPTQIENDPIAAAVNGAQYATRDGMDDVQKKKYESECNQVKALQKEYDQARAFDKDARAQYAIDRRYAAGTADLTWAVNTNLIGSFIDILTSFLYARDPDVSVKKSPRVDNHGTKQDDDFAKTMELVISRLWKKSALKKRARKQVRSALSVSEGWLKVVMIAESPDMPEMQTRLNDLRDNMAELAATREELQGQALNTDEIDVKIAEQTELMESLQKKVEVSIRKTLAIDFVAAQDMQVSLDVASTEDHLDADWNANAIYKPKSQLKKLFPKLTDEDIKGAKCYYLRPTKISTSITQEQQFTGLGGGVDAREAEQYVSDSGNAGSSDGSQIEFAKIIEIWDRTTCHIKTIVDGVKCWAKDPYEPPYASTRFYPYFRLAFYEVDGGRSPQSLSWRLQKLQDEYARSRSNFRVTRERAIPATLFNATALPPEEARKIEKSTHQEMIGLNLPSPDTPMQNVFAAKPYEKIDQRMFDNTQILSDMERISGVQEALQSSQPQTDITATQAEIQQSGFASRTTADRDQLETLLTELANYTAEVAIGALNTRDVQRIAGVAAFWPEGMDIDDLLTMVEIEITAGTTGKPKAQGDRQAWGVILPTLKEAIIESQQAIQQGNIPLAKAIGNLIGETMRRMGDDSDPDQFMPQIPDATSPEGGAGGPPGLPGPALPGGPVGGAPLPGGPPSLPPAVGGAPGAVPHEPSVHSHPHGHASGPLMPPNLQNPQLPA
jgi:hypothetical protein